MYSGLMRSGLRCSDILLLCISEAPHLVPLDTLGANVTDILVVECLADAAGMDQELCDCIQADVRYPADRATAVALAQERQDRSAPLSRSLFMGG